MRVGLPLTDQPQRRSPFVLALVALVTLQLFRANHQWHLAFVVADAAVALALAAGIARWSALRSRPAWRTAGLVATTSRLAACPRAVWMLLFSLLPLGVQCQSRPFGIGDPNETIGLLCIQNAALVTALSPALAHRRASCLLSSFLVLFVMFATVDMAVYTAAGVFGFLGIWALMGDYWDRLSVRLATHSRRQVPLRGWLTLVSLAAVLLVLSLGLGWGRHAQVPILAGFMPTSGGDRWGGTYNRGGVGEGDQLISATEHAATVGPVESDLFLASEQPSLYDAFNDVYGEPVRQSPRERAIALDAKLGREREQRIAEAHQAGRDFPTVRQPAQSQQSAAQDRPSAAMLLVQGEVPLHLRLETYNQFDGTDWSHVETSVKPLSIRLTPVGGRPWMRADRFDPHGIFGGKRAHVAKVINLQSPRVAAPAGLVAWLIDRVDRPSFFEWTSDDVLAMPDRKAVPALTVTHLLSRIATRQRVVGQGDFSVRGADRPSRAPAVAPHAAVARSWVADLPRGWLQVQAVVQRLRTHYVDDRAAIAPASSPDVVAHFLAAGRGPDYLFATTAAVLLRCLDYRVRLVSGFYAHPDKYDARDGHTRVDKEDVHVWVEVCIDGYNWLPLEPTPSYEEPPLRLNWAETFAQACGSVWHWGMAHRIGLAAGLLGLISTICLRRGLFDVFSYAIWCGVWRGSARQRVWRTLKLLEWRAWMASRARPRRSTLAAWYGQYLGDLPQPAATSLASLLAVGDWSLYSDPAAAPPFTEEALRRACRGCAWHCTTRRLCQCGWSRRRRWRGLAALRHAPWQSARRLTSRAILSVSSS